MSDERSELLARLEKLKARAVERMAERDELRSITGQLRAGEVRASDVVHQAVPVDHLPMHRADTYEPPPSAKPVPTKIDRSPRGTVKMAKERLQRASLTLTRRLEDLTEEAMKIGPACKTCGRGAPREEELRLKAIIAALDRAGVSAAASRDAGLGDVEAGPLLVFPPGTRIAVLAETPDGHDGAPGAGLRATTDGVRLTRGDLYG